MRLRASLLQSVVAGLVGFAAAAWTMTDAPDKTSALERSGEQGEIAGGQTTRSTTPGVRIEYRMIGTGNKYEAPAAPERPIPDPQVAIQNVRDHAAKREGMHQRDSVDVMWAEKTASAVADGLAPVAEEAGFDVVQIDCRTESCRIDLEWANYDHAQLEADRLVDAVRAVNCGIDVPLVPPSDPAAAYESPFYLDCSRTRT